MTSIGVYSNLDKCEARRDHDYYSTPWHPTEALILAEHDALARYSEIWEPACGDGAISEVLKLHGYKVESSDLVDRGYGQGGIDFLLCHTAPRGTKALITNPPFNLAEDFIRHAITDLGCPYMALLLKAQYFHADCRVALWRDCPPARIYPLAWRVDFTGGGANHTDCSWYIWEKPYNRGMCLYMPPLEKPKIMGQRRMR